MASVTKCSNGKFRAFIRKKNLSKSKVFDTKKEAVRWANKQEVLYDQYGGKLSKQPFSTAIRKYLDTVTPTKKSRKSESLRLNRFLNDMICTIAIDELKPVHFENWRDRRLKEVSSASVKREMDTISAILNHCVKSWEILTKNPMANVKRPPNSKARDRLPTTDEINRIYFALDYEPYMLPKKKTQWVGACMLFAIETGMRASEITTLLWSNVSEKSVYLPDTKSGHPRTVPLSKNARKLIDSVRRDDAIDVFNINSTSLDALYRKYRHKAMVDDLRFHDFRHFALTNMAEKVPVLTLAKISGHRDVRELLNTYYNPDITDVADLI